MWKSSNAQDLLKCMMIRKKPSSLHLSHVKIRACLSVVARTMNKWAKTPTILHQACRDTLTNDGSSVALPVGSHAVVSPIDDVGDQKKTKEEVVDEILWNDVWESSDPEVVEDGLGKLAGFCFHDEVTGDNQVKEASSFYQATLCQDQRLSVVASAFTKWAENPTVVVSAACAVTMNVSAFQEEDVIVASTAGLMEIVVVSMRKHPNLEALGNLLLDTRSKTVVSNRLDETRDKGNGPIFRRIELQYLYICVFNVVSED